MKSPTPPTPSSPTETPPVKRGPGRGRHLMPSGLTASRLSVYSTGPGQAWLKAQAHAAGFTSIGQWADSMALVSSH